MARSGSVMKIRLHSLSLAPYSRRLLHLVLHVVDPYRILRLLVLPSDHLNGRVLLRQATPIDNLLRSKKRLSVKERKALLI